MWLQYDVLQLWLKFALKLAKLLKGLQFYFKEKYTVQQIMETLALQKPLVLTHDINLELI